jgi:hypothetical protein
MPSKAHENIVDTFVAEGFSRKGFRAALRHTLGSAAEHVRGELCMTPNAWRVETAPAVRVFTCVEVVCSGFTSVRIDRYALLWHAVDYYCPEVELCLLLAVVGRRDPVDLVHAYYNVLLRHADRNETSLTTTSRYAHANPEESSGYYLKR